MTPASALVLGVAIGSIAVLVAQWSLLLIGKTAMNRLPGQVADLLSVRPQQGDPQAATVVDAEVVEEPEVEDEPLDMHPDIPPVWRTARNDRPDLHCSCHGKPVKAGDKLLWWTRPDESVLLYCPEVVDESAKAAGLA